MRKTEATVFIHCDPSKVIEAFTEQKLLNGWWGVERSLVEKKVGGIYSVAWGISEQGIKYISTGVIGSYHPEKELIVEKFIYFNPEKQILGPTTLSVFAEKKNDGCEVRVIQGGYQSGGDWDWWYEAVVDAWPRVVQQLKIFLEGI